MTRVTPLSRASAAGSPSGRSSTATAPRARAPPPTPARSAGSPSGRPQHRRAAHRYGSARAPRHRCAAEPHHAYEHALDTGRTLHRACAGPARPAAAPSTCGCRTGCAPAAPAAAGSARPPAQLPGPVDDLRGGPESGPRGTRPDAHRQMKPIPPARPAARRSRPPRPRRPARQSRSSSFPSRHSAHDATAGQVCAIARLPTTSPKCPARSDVSYTCARGAARRIPRTIGGGAISSTSPTNVSTGHVMSASVTSRSPTTNPPVSIRLCWMNCRRNSASAGPGHDTHPSRSRNRRCRSLGASRSRSCSCRMKSTRDRTDLTGLRT